MQYTIFYSEYHELYVVRSTTAVTPRLTATSSTQSSHREVRKESETEDGGMDG